MAFTQLSLGLTLTIPTAGTKNWAATLQSTTWTKISQHNHTGSGDGNQMITASYADYSVTTAKLAKNSGRFQYGSTLEPAGTTQTIDWNNGVIQKLDLGAASGDVTLTLSNPSQGARYRVFITQGATPRAITWPAAVKWPQGQAIILSEAEDAVDMVELYYYGSNDYADWNVGYE
jgi:hypothetical protein